MELAEIVEAAVIGIEEQIYGEQIAALVVPESSADLSKEVIRRHCQKRLARVKVPKLIKFVNSLPKSKRGKLDRKKLKRNWYESMKDHAD